MDIPILIGLDEVRLHGLQSLIVRLKLESVPQWWRLPLTCYHRYLYFRWFYTTSNSLHSSNQTHNAYGTQKNDTTRKSQIRVKSIPELLNADNQRRTPTRNGTQATLHSPQHFHLSRLTQTMHTTHQPYQLDIQPRGTHVCPQEFRTHLCPKAVRTSGSLIHPFSVEQFSSTIGYRQVVQIVDQFRTKTFFV